MFRKRLTELTMNYREHTGLSCSIPCSMYSVLLGHGLIEDPFYRMNEIEARELARYPVSFTSEFEVNSGTLAMKNILLRFERIDTLCKITLNGKSLLETDNMHRTYTVDVKALLVEGQNTLTFDFSSALVEMDKRQKEHYLAYDMNCTAGHSHLRKAFYMSGWDWAPTLSDMGIYAAPELIAFNHKIIDRVITRQIHNGGDVTLEIELLTQGDDDMSRAVATLVSPSGNVYYTGLVSGKGRINIPSPNLWWPNGLGPQNLYKLSVNLYSENEIEDSREIKIGLRTLTVSRNKDEWGEEFALTVNGVKFFSMGANYVPEDSIIPRMTPERTRELLTQAKSANFNTLRVWGGAFYPFDYFYDICDELGLVVWQDYMVACGNILMNDKNRENFIEEFKDNFTRLGHHASLGIVSGNNEMEEFITFSEMFDGEDVRRDYLELYENILPSLMAEYLPDTFYWPSSPSSGGGFDNPKDTDRGDSHYWDVWSGGAPFEDCRNYYFRYMSEFGFESLPNIKTVRAFAEGDDLNIFSPVMEWHQKKKTPDGNKMMIRYASDIYRYAFTFEDFVYMTQLTQADAIRYTVEHMRRNRGRCMGSIYWQFNDCWPVASWSSIDYYQRWKALHYAARKFYAPVLLSVKDEGTRVTFNISNEQRKAYDGRFYYSVVDSRNNLIFTDTFPISVPEMSSLDILTADLESVIKGHEDEYYLVYSTQDGLGAHSEGTLLFTKPKYFKLKKPELNYEIAGQGRSFTITITSDVFAKGVEIDFESIDASFSDNYFDVTSPTPVRISFTTREVTNVATLKRQLRLRSVYNIGRN